MNNSYSPISPLTPATENVLGYEVDVQSGMLTSKSAKKYFSQFGWFSCVLSALYTFFTIVIITVLDIFAPSLLQNVYLNEFLSFIPLYLFAFPISFIVICQLPKVKPKKKKMGAGNWFVGLCICIALLIVGNHISNIFITVFGFFLPSRPANPLSSTIESSPIWLTFLTVVILAPILEELVFRGLVCKRLLALGEGYSIILSSALFALLHGNFYQLFYAFTLGCFFGFVYVKTGKLRYSIAYHMAVNAIGSLIPLILTSIINTDIGSDTLSALVSIGSTVLLLVFNAYVYLAAIAGAIILVKKRSSFKLERGVIPPPSNDRLENVILNSGVIVAIIVFAIKLFLSLI